MLIAILYPPKQPAETFVLAIDFSPELGPEDEIATKAVTSRRLADGQSSTSSFLAGSPGGDATSCTMRVVGGADGETHRVQMRVTTALGNTYENELDVPVEES